LNAKVLVAALFHSASNSKSGVVARSRAASKLKPLFQSDRRRAAQFARRKIAVAAIVNEIAISLLANENSISLLATLA
jgi:hypothetical protein